MQKTSTTQDYYERLQALFLYCWSSALVALTIWGAAQFFRTRNFQYVNAKFFEAEEQTKPDALELKNMNMMKAARKRCFQKIRQQSAVDCNIRRR